MPESDNVLESVPRDASDGVFGDALHVLAEARDRGGPSSGVEVGPIGSAPSSGV